ncbi:hypothetical protein OAO01_06605 [Oligoflexia bacterium]|nr:hypothetical protein [Oligoflexia bacterium]
MLTGMPTDRLTPEQAPPLSLPLCFFFTAPFFLLAAGCILIFGAEEILPHYWMTKTLGLAHAGTLGFLAMVMFGAVYQMIPVVAGRPVPLIKLGYIVYLLFVPAVILMIWGISTLKPPLLQRATELLTVATLLFGLPTLYAAFTAPTKHDTVLGIRMALIALFCTVGLGICLALSYLGILYPGPRSLWIVTHFTFGLFGWVATLMIAVAWQVIPMFYMTPFYAPHLTRLFLWLLGGGLIVTALGWIAGIVWEEESLVLAGLSILAFTAWVLHPALTAYLITKRRRSNRDGSLNFWRCGLICAPLALLSGLCGYLLSDLRYLMLFGWVAIFGWAGLIMHGMLCRIVPFLVWFHRFSPFVGKILVPSMKKLLPETRISQALYLHLITLVCGSVAILTQSVALTKVTGALLGITALVMFRNTTGTLKHKVVTDQ